MPTVEAQDSPEVVQSSSNTLAKVLVVIYTYIFSNVQFNVMNCHSKRRHWLHYLVHICIWVYAKCDQWLINQQQFTAVELHNLTYVLYVQRINKILSSTLPSCGGTVQRSIISTFE